MNKVIKVLHTEWSLGWGGQEIRILAESKTFIDKGYEMIIAAQPNSVLYKKSNEAGIPTFAIKMNKGINFEDDVMEMVKINLSELNIQQVCHNVDDVHNMDNMKVTIDHMKNGVDVIYQGLLVDKKNKFYGSPDLIIKNTVLNQFFPELVYNNTEGCKFLENEHYVICDIKSSTIHMNSDDITMRNSGSMKAFKGQLYIYHSILNDIQETDNKIALIWAKNKRNDNSKMSKEFYLEKYFHADEKNFSGVNAMSISEITGIPRATVIRKLNRLLKEKFLKIDEKKHYSLTGFHAKKILSVQKNTLDNLSNLAARIYNLSLMKDN